jgi:predicted nucleic acid-binding protein
MALYFLDSSALVKRYISETGSVWVLGLFAAAFNNEIFIAAIAKRRNCGCYYATIPHWKY